MAEQENQKPDWEKEVQDGLAWLEANQDKKGTPEYEEIKAATSYANDQIPTGEGEGAIAGASVFKDFVSSTTSKVIGGIATGIAGATAGYLYRKHRYPTSPDTVSPAQFNMINKMLAEGSTPSVIAELTGLPQEKIEAYANSKKPKPEPQSKAKVTVEPAPSTGYRPAISAQLAEGGIDHVKYNQFINEGLSHTQAVELASPPKPTAPPQAEPAPFTEYRPAVSSALAEGGIDPARYNQFINEGLSHPQATELASPPKPIAPPKEEIAPFSENRPFANQAYAQEGIDVAKYNALRADNVPDAEARRLAAPPKLTEPPSSPLQSEAARVLSNRGKVDVGDFNALVGSGMSVGDAIKLATPVEPEGLPPFSENRPYTNQAYGQEGLDVAKYNALRAEGISEGEARRLATPPAAQQVDEQALRREQLLKQGYIPDEAAEAKKLGLTEAPRATTSIEEVERRRLENLGYKEDVAKKAGSLGLTAPYEGGSSDPIERRRQLELSGDFIPNLEAEAREVGLKPLEPEAKEIFEKAIKEGKPPAEAKALAIEVSGKINQHYTSEAVKYVPATESKNALLLAIRTDPTMSAEAKRIAAEAIFDLSDEVVQKRIRAGIDKQFYGAGARNQVPPIAPTTPVSTASGLTSPPSAGISPEPTGSQASSYAQAEATLRPVEQQPEMDMFGEAEKAAVSEKQVQGTNKLSGAPPIEEIPVSQLKLSKDVPQFKTGAGTGGVVQALEGRYERIPTEPIQVWERLNGDLEVVSGRHRLDLGRRNKENTLPVQIHRESEGFTKEMAMRLDAESNIRQGQGKLVDYIDALSNMTEGEAQSKGLLSRQFGKNALTVAKGATENTIGNLRNGNINESTAVEIARNFPNNNQVQDLVLDQVAKGKTPMQAIEIGNALKAQAFEKGQMQQAGDMFGFDDTMAKEAAKIAKIAGEEKAAITARLSAMTGAAKNPKLAKQEGIDIKDEAAVKARIAQLKEEKAKLDNWASDPETRKRILEMASKKGGGTTLSSFAGSLSVPPGLGGDIKRLGARGLDATAKGLGAYGVLDAAVGGLPFDIIGPLFEGKLPRITQEFDVVRDKNASTGLRTKEEIMGELGKYKKALNPASWEFNPETKAGFENIKRFLKPGSPNPIMDLSYPPY